MMKTIIVAYDKNYGIGANNELLWQGDLPADLQNFKKLTTGNAIIMGLNTYNSIGKKEDIHNLKIKDCIDYYKEYYKYPSKIINVSKNNEFDENIKFNDFDNNYHIKYDFNNKSRNCR